MDDCCDCIKREENNGYPQTMLPISGPIANNSSNPGSVDFSANCFVCPSIMTHSKLGKRICYLFVRTNCAFNPFPKTADVP